MIDHPLLPGEVTDKPRRLTHFHFSQLLFFIVGFIWSYKKAQR